jgi:hypothetical protein
MDRLASIACQVQIKRPPSESQRAFHSRAIDAFYFNLVDAMRRGRFPTDVAVRKCASYAGNRGGSDPVPPFPGIIVHLASDGSSPCPSSSTTASWRDRGLAVSPHSL